VGFGLSVQPPEHIPVRDALSALCPRFLQVVLSFPGFQVVLSFPKFLQAVLSIFFFFSSQLGSLEEAISLFLFLVDACSCEV
jgi:hypothetical protein